MDFQTQQNPNSSEAVSRRKLERSLKYNKLIWLFTAINALFIVPIFMLCSDATRSVINISIAGFFIKGVLLLAGSLIVSNIAMLTGITCFQEPRNKSRAITLTIALLNFVIFVITLVYFIYTAVKNPFS